MQEQVSEFMRAAGQTVFSTPTAGSYGDSDKRFSIIFEELEEYKCADHIEDIADAIGDMLYTVIGAACQHGINIEPIFEEIHRSNMTKFVDGHLDVQSGKWIKGPSYSPANLKPIIDAQMK